MARSPNMACWMLLEGICSTGCALFLLNPSQASWVSAINERAEDPNGALVRLGSTHSLFLLQPLRVVTGCWKAILSQRCSQKTGRGKKEHRLYSLCTATYLSVPPSICKVKVMLHSPERCKGATGACNLNELFWQQVQSNKILKLLYSASMYNTFNPLFWDASKKEWNLNRTVKKWKTNGYLQLSITLNCSRHLGSTEVPSWLGTWNVIST